MFDKLPGARPEARLKRPSDNPFRPAPGSDPPVMVGRDQEISAVDYSTALTKSAAPAQPIIFTGLRGMGKTALLRRCARDARQQDAIVVYAEATDSEPLHESLRRGLERASRDVESVPHKLKTSLDSIIRAMPRAAIELPGGIGSVELRAAEEEDRPLPFVDVLHELNEAVRKHDHALVFAVDELQDAPLPDLRSLVRFIHETAGTSEPVLFLGAGLPNTPDRLHHVRTYTERWRYFRIGLLTQHETMEAISIPARERGVTIARNALERLAEESAGYPFFIQEYASATWLRHTGPLITLQDVEAVVPGVRRILEDDFYDARFRRLTPREVAYTIAMATLGPGPHAARDIAAKLGSDSARLSSIRNQLIKKDVVYSPSGGMLEFRIPLTDRYVMQHRPALELRAREAPGLTIGL